MISREDVAVDGDLTLIAALPLPCSSLNLSGHPGTSIRLYHDAVGVENGHPSKVATIAE